ncbi:hypothetical protein C0585_06870 [Candidatus Woesearchaeota archaeon]|nr:MAG: hypothetical protein C0585_06870 [Candidatus Woesearchaeota archaeon]
MKFRSTPSGRKSPVRRVYGGWDEKGSEKPLRQIIEESSGTSSNNPSNIKIDENNRPYKKILEEVSKRLKVPYNGILVNYSDDQIYFRAKVRRDSETSKLVFTYIWESVESNTQNQDLTYLNNAILKITPNEETSLLNSTHYYEEKANTLTEDNFSKVDIEGLESLLLTTAAHIVGVPELKKELAYSCQDIYQGLTIPKIKEKKEMVQRAILKKKELEKMTGFDPEKDLKSLY